MFFFIVHLSISGDIISTAAAFERIALYLIIYWKDRQLNSKKQKEKESYGCLPANHLRPGTERAAAYNSCTSLSLFFIVLDEYNPSRWIVAPASQSHLFLPHTHTQTHGALWCIVYKPVDIAVPWKKDGWSTFRVVAVNACYMNDRCPQASRPLSFRRKDFLPSLSAAAFDVSLPLDSATIPPLPRSPFASVLPLTDTSVSSPKEKTRHCDAFRISAGQMKLGNFK